MSAEADRNTMPASDGHPTLTSGARTHVGGVRDHNEDAFHAGAHACVVADGMGGHAAGEVASHLVRRMVADSFSDPTYEVTDLPVFISSLNSAIQRTGKQNDTPGMGTTVVGVVVARNGNATSAVVFHVGDSRCYRLADGIMTQLTVDHSHVEELIRAGRITRQEAHVHPLRNVVTRALGADDTVEADYYVLPEENCRLLLCSDGLSGEIDDDRIRDLLTSHPDQATAASALVDAVLEGPARDNVTAVVVDVEFPAIEDHHATDVVPVSNATMTEEVDVTAEVAFDPETVEVAPVRVAEHDEAMVTIPWAPPTVPAPPRSGQNVRFDRPPDGPREAAWGEPSPPANHQETWE